MSDLWSEGVCGDGAAILCDGVMVPIEEIIEALNHREALRIAFKRLPRYVEYRLPTHEQCATQLKVEPDRLTELERFIYENEPAGNGDDAWRASLSRVLSETVMEDRESCLPEMPLQSGDSLPRGLENGVAEER